MEPPEVMLPGNIKHLVLLNRTKPSNSDKVFNFIEGVLTGEQILADRRSSVSCLEGFARFVPEKTQFTAFIPGEPELKCPDRAMQFPVPLTHEEIKDLCAKFEADALVVLEFFDSDFKKRMDAVPVTTRADNGATVTYTKYLAGLDVRISSGWRIYDGKSGLVIDEHRITDSRGFSGEATSETEAAAMLPDREDKIREMGYDAGLQYGGRIAPSWIIVNRALFTRGNDNMKKAWKSAKVHNWDPAIEIWKREASAADKKVAGRACYNMAVACESKGNLRTALECAEKSGREFGNRMARKYAVTIKKRIREAELSEKKLAEE